MTEVLAVQKPVHRISFFFLPGFSCTRIHYHFTYFLPLPPISPLQRDCSQLAAGLELGTLGYLTQVANYKATRPLKFAFSTLALVTAVVRRMLKTWVKNIYCLINLIKRLYLQCSKTPPLKKMLTQLTFMFSFQFINYGSFSP